MQTARGRGKIRKSSRTNNQWLSISTKNNPGHLYTHEKPSVTKTKYKEYHRGKND